MELFQSMHIAFEHCPINPAAFIQYPRILAFTMNGCRFCLQRRNVIYVECLRHLNHTCSVESRSLKFSVFNGYNLRPRQDDVNLGFPGTCLGFQDGPLWNNKAAVNMHLAKMLPCYATL